MIIISPVISRLKELGYYVILNTGKRGMEVFKDDPRVDEFIEHDENVAIEEVVHHWAELEKNVKHDLFINFSESIECNIALHPRNPRYIYSKKERAVYCNKNYYEVTNEWSKLEGCDLTPSLHFKKSEHSKVKEYIKQGKFNVLWCLSGSGKQKAYPWTDYVMGTAIKAYPDIHFITVGDKKCQILEDLVNSFPRENVTQLAGNNSFRESMLLTQYADLVISPDTGILHASGCYKTPKIGLLGHTTRENITKHFNNDYSIESQCECAPCFRLIYDWEIQCPLDPVSKAAWCMFNIRPEQVFDKIKEVREGFYGR